MPYIIENGELKFVTKEELDAYNQANPISDIVPAGGGLRRHGLGTDAGMAGGRPDDVGDHGCKLGGGQFVHR